MGKEIRCRLITPPIGVEQSVDITYECGLAPDVIEYKTTVRYKYLGSQDGIRYYRRVVGGTSADG